MKITDNSYDGTHLLYNEMSDSSESSAVEPIQILNVLDQIQGPATFQALLDDYFDPEELNETFLDSPPLDQYKDRIAAAYDSQQISNISGDDFFCIIGELRDSLTEDSVEELRGSISGVLLGTFIRLYTDQKNQLGWAYEQTEKIEALYF